MGFAADLKRLCDAAGDKAGVVVQRTALDMGGQLLERSPVDSGRFRNNWVTSVGAMDTSANAQPDKSGAAAAGMLQQKVADWKPGQTIWIVNNLPYARRLEYDGWSKQAPAGVVRLTVQNFADAFAKAARELK